MAPDGKFVFLLQKKNDFLDRKDSPCIVQWLPSSPADVLRPGAGVSLNGDGGGKSFVQCFLHS